LSHLVWLLLLFLLEERGSVQLGQLRQLDVLQHVLHLRHGVLFITLLGLIFLGFTVLGLNVLSFTVLGLLGRGLAVSLFSTRRACIVLVCCFVLLSLFLVLLLLVLLLFFFLLSCNFLLVLKIGKLIKNGEDEEDIWNVGVTSEYRLERDYFSP
jgi:hypothetical protein